MTSGDARQFVAVLEELRALLSELGDMSQHVVLVGGQTLSIESLHRGGDGVIRVRTATGVVIDRGFSMEPDLLVNVDALPHADRLPEVLRARGYVRACDYRWSKAVLGTVLLVDLFVSENAGSENLPTGMTALPGGDLAIARSTRRTVHLSGGDLNIAVPDPAAFLGMKLAAKLRLRPQETKDAFDNFAYVLLIGVDTVAESLRSIGEDGARIAGDVASLFASAEAPGVRDVLAYAASLDATDRQLLARAAVDLFDDLARKTGT